MARDEPDWLVLIAHWCTRGGTGYSLPFLLAARQMREGWPFITVENARNMLAEMFRPAVVRKPLSLTWCPDLDVPVFDLGDDLIRGIVLSSPHTSEPSLFVRQDIVERWSDTAESLEAGLLAHAEKPIVSGRVSRTWEREWAPLSQDESTRIRNLLHLHDHDG